MRKVSFFFFLFFSIISLNFSSFAGVASGSNARRVPHASWSNASKAWDDFKDSFDQINDVDTVVSDDISVSASGPDENYGKSWWLMAWFDNNTGVNLVWNDTYGYYRLPDDYINKGYKIYNVRLCIARNRLPSSGTYLFKYDFVQGSVVNKIYKADLQFDLVQKNTLDIYPKYEDVPYSQSGSHISGSYNVTIPSRCVRLSLLLYPSGSDPAVNFSGVSFSFGQIPDSSVGTADSGVKSDSSQDTADNTATIAENSNRQVEQGDSIIELIKNTIQTISSQLESFWNQLAGEFTNLYNKMNQHHSEDLAKVDEQISADRQNTDDLITNQDKNTDQITGGYDSSGLDSSGNKLNDSLTGLEDNENAIHDQASGWITDFTLPNFDQLLESGGILAACLWLGQFWQSMFTNMGTFNIPVTLSLCLIFVLMLVGYHRFKR